MRRRKQRGNAILEFTLTGIPLIFVWISIVQMCIGMWRFETLQYAVKQAGSYVSVHGQNCYAIGNNCKIQIQDAARVLQRAAPGLPGTLSVKFRVFRSDHTTEYASPIVCTLDNCLTNATYWPPSGWRDPLTNEVEISATYSFRSALGMFAPGAGKVKFGEYTLPAYTRQLILF